jgi:hypothetical protein
MGIFKDPNWGYLLNADTIWDHIAAVALFYLADIGSGRWWGSRHSYLKWVAASGVVQPPQPG